MDLYVQRDQPPGVPPLALDGERTLPDVPEENYWFQRHVAVYEWVARHVAGHETTANTLAWAFERLSRTPGGLERVASDGAYAEAAVRETLRLRPVIAVVARRLTRAAEIGGLALPAGAVVTPCILLVHRRPDVYPDPDAFRPERFLDRPPGTYTWIPFGGGVRRCLGASFAQMELEVVLRRIAQRVALAPVGEPEPVRRRAITLVPARGGEVRVLARR